LGIFRRKTAAPEIDLEQLIDDIAEFQRDTDFQRLYSDIAKREVFLPVVPGTLPPSMPSGIRYVTEPDDQIQNRNRPRQAPDCDGGNTINTPVFASKLRRYSMGGCLAAFTET
jgi:hypothetical protein